MDIDRVARSPNGSPRARTTIRMKTELLEELRTTAAQEDRTMTHVLEKILDAGLKARRDPPEAEAPSAFE